METICNRNGCNLQTNNILCVNCIDDYTEIFWSRYRICINMADEVKRLRFLKPESDVNYICNQLSQRCHDY